MRAARILRKEQSFEIESGRSTPTRLTRKRVVQIDSRPEYVLPAYEHEDSDFPFDRLADALAWLPEVVLPPKTGALPEDDGLDELPLCAGCGEPPELLKPTRPAGPPTRRPQRRL